MTQLPVGRIDRRAMSWLIALVVVASIGEVFIYDEPIGYATLPLRLGLLALLFTGVRSDRIRPIVAGRYFLVLGITSMLMWAVLVDAEQENVLLEVTGYGAILSVFALIVAPRAQRRWWAGSVIAVVVVSGAIRLPVDAWPKLGGAVAILLVHFAALITLDSHAVTAERASEMVSIDPLTGLYNRRPVLDRLRDRLDVARAGDGTSSLILLDLDRFKDLNDSRGHHAGDEALRQVGRCLLDNVRAIDMVSRWGGEEFLVLLPGIDRAGALVVAERLRASVAATGITASFGVEEVQHRESVDAWINRADRAMYAAKRDGRDRVSSIGPDAA